MKQYFVFKIKNQDKASCQTVKIGYCQNISDICRIVAHSTVINRNLVS